VQLQAITPPELWQILVSLLVVPTMPPVALVILVFVTPPMLRFPPIPDVLTVEEVPPIPVAPPTEIPDCEGLGVPLHDKANNASSPLDEIWRDAVMVQPPFRSPNSRTMAPYSPATAWGQQPIMAHPGRVVAVPAHSKGPWCSGDAQWCSMNARSSAEALPTATVGIGYAL
jgi:hypothetical protein